MIDLVRSEIQACEKENKSWIIQGFPRTKVQSLALQKIGVIPDRFILLKVKPSASIARIKNNLISVNQSLYGPELEELASQCLQEYELNMRGVRDAFNQFIYEFDAQDKAQNDVSQDLAKMLKLRFKSNAPRRPPRVILVGPPGSGRSSQAKILAEMFGLVNISTRQLLKSEIKRNKQAGQTIAECIARGELIPDGLVNSVIEQRIKQSDCRVNGWILEGFPQTEA